MKTISIIAASASLFAACSVALPAPAATSSTTVQIVVKTGDGDSAAGLTATLDQVLSTAGQPQAARGVAASIDDPTVICQTFSDNAATKPLGAPFTAAKPASFSATSNGGTGSKLADAVPLGAFLCSHSANGVKPKGPKGSTGGQTATARVQLETESDTFFQNDVPVDGSVFLTGKTNFGTSALDMAVVTATGVNPNEVSCQAFADKAAKKPIGGPTTVNNNGAVLSKNRNQPATINAIVCTA